ncbi:hypothetical protein KKE06_05575 [Candidatus Micrarchaeota archaeon]|nr:hypothetical protein [Candidatus Micrarchaeota archaeon]MBU1930597.1 hypothetical protein [Candidatus Micrarchaeota archaeon]
MPSQYHIEQLSQKTPSEKELEFARIVKEGEKPLGYVGVEKYDYRKSGTFFIMNNNGQAVGFGTLFPKKRIDGKTKELVVTDIYISQPHRANLNIVRTVGNFFVRESQRNGWAPIRGNWLMPMGKRVFEAFQKMYKRGAIKVPDNVKLSVRFEPYNKGLKNRFFLWSYYRRSVVKKLPDEELPGYVRNPDTQELFKKHFGEQQYKQAVEDPKLFLQWVGSKDPKMRQRVSAFLKEHKKTVMDGVVRFQHPFSKPETVRRFAGLRPKPGKLHQPQPRHR